MTTRSTKKSLMLSCLALLLCFSMLIGTTFAWFTDEVTSKGNIIKSGTLDIEMLYADGDEDPAKADWKDASKDAIFNSKLWEPGRTDARHINIINNGSLALKYQLLIEPTGEVSDLANVIDVYFIEGGKQLTRDALDTYTPQGTLAELIKDGIAFGSLTAGQNRIFTIVLKMQETAGNKYQDKSIGSDFAIKLLATQLTSEKDSFGPDYDKDAWHPEMEVYSANDLQSAINNGETNIVLMADIESAETLSIPEGATVTLNLNGKKLSGAGVDAEGKVHTLVNNGTLTLENGTVSSKGTNGGSAIYNNGVLAMENVTVYGAPSDTATGTASYAVNTQGANSKLTITNSNITGRGAVGATKGTKVEINGGNYYTPAVAWGHAVYADGDGTEVVINGGTFSEGWDYAANLWGMYQIYSGNKAKVTINGGDFSQQWDCANGYDLCTATEGVIEINGGFFAENPSSQNGKNFVADGFKVVAKNGVYVVISNTIADENVVATPSELKSAMTGAADANSGNNTIYLTGDIDMTGSAWTPVKVDGYHGAGIVTIEGNGATIKGLTAPLFEGGFAGKSGIVIKNLTIADSNIVGGTQGGGAFIDCADSMHVITLENCHLVNSTVSGERAGGLIGWCSGYAKLDDGPVKAYVTISNCSVVDSKVIGNGSAGGIAGHPGASDYTYTTIENCLVKGVDVISYEPVSSWRTGAIVGTANNGHVVINNVTVEDVTLTQDGVTAEETKLYGRFVPATTGTLVIDGAYVLPAATTESLNNAIASGNTNVYLPAGEYKMPSSGSSNTFVITGTKDAVVDVTLGAYMDYANVTFEGVTIKTGTGKVNGNGSDYAAFYSKDVTYKNCTFEGPMRVGRDGAKFIECTFNNLGNDYVWTYGNDVTFERCTFNTDGKAILVYSDGGNEVAKVTVKDCTFNSTQGAKAGAIANQNCAAIEIHNYGNGVDLVTEGNTYDANFSGEWRIKTYENGRTKVFVNGTEYTTIALDGKIMTIDANKNVTVQ